MALSVVRGWLARGLGRGVGPRLELSQSLGAFARPGGEGISPLYVLFEVRNAGSAEVEISRLYVAPRKGSGPAYEGPFEGKRGGISLPRSLAPGESLRFWTRAKTLAGSLKRIGRDGSPRVSLVVEDGRGNRREKAFRFRVDEYLRLKDD